MRTDFKIKLIVFFDNVTIAYLTDRMTTTLEQSMTDNYEAEHSIATELVKDRDDPLYIVFDNSEMEEIVSADDNIVLQINRDCYCYKKRSKKGKKPILIPLSSNGRPITKRMCCEAILNTDFKCCNHFFLEGFCREKGDAYVVYFGS